MNTYIYVYMSLLKKIQPKYVQIRTLYVHICRHIHIDEDM
jgi:hypothetical protein